MDDDTILPEDDKDLELSRRIRDRLEEGAADDAVPDADDGGFYEMLLAFKKRSATARPSDDASQRMWTRIDAATRERPRRLERLPAARIRRRWAWAAAAVIAMAGVIAVLTLQAPEPILLASATDEIVEYEAADGSVVTLRPRSSLYLVSESGGDATYRLDGEAFFDVTPRSDRVFAVEAGEAVVVVLGTRFNVDTWGEGTSVYLSEGRVRLEHRATGTEAVLEPGQWSRVTADGRLIPPEAEPANEHLDWLDGEIVFRSRPARQIAAEIERHFGVSLDIPAAGLDETLTGRILLENRVQSLEDFGQVLGGRFVETGPDSYRYTSP